MNPVSAPSRRARRLIVVGPESPERRGFARYVVDELGNTSSTAFTYECNISRVERFCGKPIETFTVGDVRRWIRDAPYHPSTRNGGLVAVKAYVRFGLIEGWMDPARAAAILAIKARRQKRRPKRTLTLTEVHAVLDACRTSNDHRAVYLPLYQGVRVSDAAKIGEEEFWEDRLAFVSVKGNKYLELPLHKEVAVRRDLILQRSPGRDTLKHTCRSLSHYTGIKFTPHTLRHTYARRLDDLGNQEGVVIELLGHEQITVYRRHYADVSWERMEEAQAGLWY